MYSIAYLFAITAYASNYQRFEIRGRHLAETVSVNDSIYELETIEEDPDNLDEFECADEEDIIKEIHKKKRGNRFKRILRTLSCFHQKGITSESKKFKKSD